MSSVIKCLKQRYWRFKIEEGRRVKLFVLALWAHLLYILQVGGESRRRPMLKHNVIVSLTSYPPRFKHLLKTLRTLINQSVTPDLIVLWIANDDLEKLPYSVTMLEQQFDFFKIRPCVDLGPAKKMIPALLAYPNDIIVTCDDDIWYRKNWLSSLLVEWEEDSKSIVAHRAHEIQLDDSGGPRPYNEWKFEIRTHGDSPQYFATSGAGVLIPPKTISDEVVNVTKYLQLTEKQDDVWLYWMIRLSNCVVRKSHNNDELVTWLNSQSTGLFNDNVANLKNDVAINNMLEYYGNIIKDEKPLSH